jgi:hypothetical protein
MVHTDGKPPEDPALLVAAQCPEVPVVRPSGRQAWGSRTVRGQYGLFVRILTSPTLLCVSLVTGREGACKLSASSP